MPEKETIERAHEDAREDKSPSVRGVRTMLPRCRMQILNSVLLACLLLSFAAILYAQSSEILAEVELDGATSVEKTSGVWIDGQYVNPYA